VSKPTRCDTFFFLFAGKYGLSTRTGLVVAVRRPAKQSEAEAVIPGV
jgi:hypothetical protein